MWTDELEISVQSATFHLVLAITKDRSNDQSFGLVCIYGDPYHRQTAAIWDQIVNFVYDNSNLPMLCIGDMNDLMYDSDKSSPNINRARLYNFRQHVRNCGLFDLGFSGPAYTWTNRRFSSTPLFQRLDRCLVNHDWCVAYPVSNVYNMPLLHCFSDHAPILLSTDGNMVKPRNSFKFENLWLKEDDFHEYAKNSWRKTNEKSFCNRTNHLATSLKVWCRKKKPLQEELKELEGKIAAIQSKPLHLQDHSQETELITRYEQHITKLNDYHVQRAKKNWIKDGDRNTSFFHRAIAKRRRRNTIFSVKDENDQIQFLPHRIATTFVTYFRSIFTSSISNHTYQNTDNLPTNSDDPTYTIPSKEEIWSILNDMKRNASPGPDGFNVEFYLATWEWIGDDVLCLVRNFFTDAILPDHVNNTHLALIPKKLVPLVPADYRPISLCNVIYKIIAKCLANRLKPHLPDYIHPSQQAFIQGRRISDNIIIAQEITHSFQLSSWKNQSFMLKIDLAKAFDRLEWNFILAALARKGLHGHFIKLVHSCISSPRFSVIINGQAHASFCSFRGIRQGCPLSPYLFVMAINELSLSLQEALASSQLTGITLGPNCPPVHSLLFADDLLICGKATRQEAHQMKQILMSFCNVSGQFPNWSKSGIIFSKYVDATTKQQIKAFFPVPHIDDSFTHLGHPLILPPKNRSEAYNFVLDKFRTKLSTYKANSLSHAARLELINSVFSSIPVYYMSNIIFSNKFLAKITAIIRNFWWTGVNSEPVSKPLCLTAWKNICAPKSEGGLGIRNIKAVNHGLILSAAWRIADNPESHLHKILKSKYFYDSSIWRPKTNIPKSAFWTSLLKVITLLQQNSFYQISSGNISLWSTPWFSNWQDIYNNLIIQEPGYQYPALVKDLWLPDTKVWNTPLIDTLFQHHTAASIKSTMVIPFDDDDILCWNLTPNGKCSTKSAYKTCLEALQNAGLPTPATVDTVTKQILHKVWNCKKMIPRVKTFAWRILRRAIPTGERASRYSKHIDRICCRCGLPEDDFHLFFTCTFARAAWFHNPWFIRTDIFVQNATSLAQVISNILSLQHPYSDLQHIFTFLWCMWKSRNEFLFRRKDSSPHQVGGRMQALLNDLEMMDLRSSSTLNMLTTATNRDPKQGLTVPTDFVFQGPKFYSDASWKKRSDGSAATAGLGIYFHMQDNQLHTDVFLLAKHRQVSSALQAEAQALCLAAQLASSMDIQMPVFFTDCRNLARAAAAPGAKDPAVLWEIRRQVIQFQKSAKPLGSSVYHIKREINGVAHGCANQARRSVRSEPISSCRNSAHSNITCPVLAAVQSMQLLGSVIIDVQCF
jgi:hypothetical protein